MACVGYWREQFSLMTDKKMFNAQTFLEGWELEFRPKLTAFSTGSVLSGESSWGHWGQAAFVADNIVQVISLYLAAQRKEVQARAVFYPLMGLGGAVNMCYRTLYIGTGE